MATTNRMGSLIRLCVTCRQRPVLKLPAEFAPLIEQARVLEPYLCRECDDAFKAAYARGEIERPTVAAFGANIRAARELRGLSVAALAHLSGVSASTILRIERGRSGWPRTPTVVRLGRAFEQYGPAPTLDVVAPERDNELATAGIADGCAVR